MIGKHALFGLGLAIAMAAGLLTATIGTLAAAQPVYARGAAPLQERAAGRLAPPAETISIAKAVNTGSGDNSVVFNGQPITYTIFITNNSTSNTANNIAVLDVLPPGTLDQINCLTTCQPLFISQQIPEPLGGTLLVTVTTQLSWTVSALAPQASTQLVFAGRVAGQTDGTVFKNRAFATFVLNGNPGAVSTPDVVTTVRAQIGQSGQPSLANAPTWFSSDLGGTLSQDWGDFNGDGQLDLVLGSSLGVSVYINQNGQLKPYWNNFSSNRRAYGVRWADVNHDGKLEIVAVGDSLDGSAVTSGTNYIYGQAAGVFTQVGSFVSDFQMVRLAVGKFTGGNNIDIVASTNTINADCPVRLFRNDGNGNFAGPGDCVSHFATAALGPADVNNSGKLDLAVGLFPNTIEILHNNGSGNFNVVSPTVVDNNVPFLPYDFAWGDYDGNGKLDLVAAFPLQKEARIYRNLGNYVFDSPMAPFHTTKFMSPLSVAWGDFNGDGTLDLAVADETPKVYFNHDGAFDQSAPMAAATVAGQVWSLRAEQVDNRGDLQLSLTNRDAPSLLFDSFSSHLAVNITPVNANSQKASSVAVGDSDGSGTIDMVLGAAPLPVQGTEINYNAGGVFPTQLLLPSGPGPQSVALGDVNGDGKLDIAVGTAVEAQLYLSGQTVPVWTSAAPNGPNHVVAFCDVNSDGKLDLLVGSNGGGVAVYLNQGGTLASSPAFTTAETGIVKAIACADVKHNHYPGFAVAFDNQPVQLYDNNFDGTFTSIWNSGTHSHTTSLAWGDFNHGGFPDLAVGNYGQGTQIYENHAGQLQAQPIWSSPTQYNTTAIAWGDWNNDGFVDLAIGNNGQPAQVFGNLGSSPGQPRLFWLWTAANSYQTTGLAWGDFSGDGHLDLALSQAGVCCNGYYRNGSVTPSHLNSNFVPTLSLPINPTYLYVRRPGTTSDGYANSASEIVGGPSQPTVTVSYTLYDSNGTRQSGITDAPGNTIVKTNFEYSLDGGSHWLTATAAAGSPGPITTTSRMGQSGTFVWDTLKDKAISDDARFRVRVVPFTPVGPVENASALAVSPPFRVEGVSCVWPQNPSITASQNPISPTIPAGFFGAVSAGSGALTYTWSFGDSPLPNPPTFLGQGVQHTYAAVGTYTVTLTVTGEPCPQNRPVVVNQLVQVGTGQISKIYLPLITRGTAAESMPAGGAATIQTKPTGKSGAASSANTKVQAVPQARPIRPQPLALANAGPPTSAVQVTTSTIGINNEPSLNGDGTRVAYWSTANTTGNNPDGNIEVYLLITNTGGLTVTQITSSTGSILGGFNLSPSIDRAGARVAFFSDRDLVKQNPDHNFEIFYYDANTAVLTQVTHTDKGFNILSSISGNGQYIAFASDRDFVGTNPDGNTEIFRAQILPDGNISFIQVTNTAGGVNDQPRINDDGSRIAFVSDHNLDPVRSANGDNNREVFLATIGPSGQVTFTQISDTTSGTTGGPSINGDGTRVAFVSNRTPDPLQPTLNPNSLREIYYADVDTGGTLTITRVTTSIVEVGNDQPSISSDGTRIGFISPGTGQVRVFDTVLGGELTATIGAALNPSVSGDGTVVAFAFNRQLYMVAYRLARLAVSKIASPGPIFQGQLFTYTVVLSNAGPSPATNIVLTDTLGAIASAQPGWLLRSVNITSPAGGACSTVTGTPITCTISSLAANTSAILTVAITPTTYGTLTNTASVSTVTPQRIAPTNANVTVNIQPLPIAAVNLVLSGPITGTAHIGSAFEAVVTPITASVPLTYSWTATNQAPRTIISAVFTDTQLFTWNPGGVQIVTVTVSNAANNVVTATKTITIFNPSPLLSSMFPTTATVNDPQFTLVLTGTGFVANSSVLWNNAPLAASFVTSATLNATVPFANLTSVGTFTVAVFSPGPGGGLSNALPFVVEYPAPSITSIAPITAARGGLTFALDVNGSNFVSGASLFFDGQPALPTVFNSSSSLAATVPFSYLLSAGTVNITVTNPSPSVGPSNTTPFTVVNPSLTLSISPPTIGVGQTAVLTATISDPQAANRTITLTSSNSSIASVPGSVILPAGSGSVTATVTGVGNPGGVATITGSLPANIGGASDSAQITVNNPTPTIAQVSPVATAGGLTFTLTLTGSSFSSGATLFWDSQAPLNIVGTGSVVTASIPASYIATPGSVAITVTNPAPNDGPSLPFAYTVVSPTISLNPNNLMVPFRTFATITATISAPQAANRVISITESVPPPVSAPTTITLPANTTSITFTVRGIRGHGILTATLPSSLGGLFDTTNITVSNPTPQISLITPNTISVSLPITIDITGNGFVGSGITSFSVISWNGTALTQTQFIDTSELTATVPVDLFPTTGVYSVTVFNPPPGGGPSNVVTVTAINPAPLLFNMSPMTAPVNTPTFTLSLMGSQFVSGSSLVYFNGLLQPTAFVDSGDLTAIIGASNMTSPGDFTVVVSTTVPGGGASSPLTFTVTTDQPVITKISPITGTINSPPFTLVVTGTGFLSPPASSGDSVIQIDNSPVTTFFQSSTHLTATITPAVDTPATGVYTVTVLNPQPPSGPDRLSNAINFTVTDPIPLLVSMSPTMTTVGDMTFTLTINGDQFVNRDSTVLWAGLPLSTTFISPQQLTATVDAAKVATVGTFNVTVKTTPASGPGGGTSAPLVFTVNNMTPTVTSVSPISLAVNSGAFVLTVTGSNFVSGTTALWSGSALATNFVDSATLTAIVPNSKISTGGIYTITALSPAPPTGGIASTTFATVTVNNPQPVITGLAPSTRAAGTAAFNLTISGTAGSFVSGVVAYWNGAQRQTGLISSTQITMAVQSNDLASFGTANITVQNPNPSYGASAGQPFAITTLTVSLAPSAGLTMPVTSSRVLTATISNVQAASTVISLTSSNPGVASVAASVVLTANTGQIPFAVTSGITGTAIITAQLPSALGGGISNPVTMTVNFSGGMAPRHGPARLIAWASRNRLGEMSGAPLVALIPAASQPSRPSRRRARSKVAGQA